MHLTHHMSSLIWNVVGRSKSFLFPSNTHGYYIFSLFIWWQALLQRWLAQCRAALWVSRSIFVGPVSKAILIFPFYPSSNFVNNKGDILFLHMLVFYLAPQFVQDPEREGYYLLSSLKERNLEHSENWVYQVGHSIHIFPNDSLSCLGKNVFSKKKTHRVFFFK